MLQEPFVDIPENVIRDALKVLLGMPHYYIIIFAIKTDLEVEGQKRRSGKAECPYVFQWVSS